MASRLPDARPILAPIRRRRRRRALVAAAIGVATIAADHQGWLLVREADDLATYDGAPARVVRVVDAATLDIDAPDARRHRTETRVRLWGLTAPVDADAVGADHARALIDGGLVRLRLEPRRRREPGGSVLAHVALADGRLLNELLLESGLANVDDRLPHAELARYEHAARRGRLARALDASGARAR